MKQLVLGTAMWGWSVPKDLCFTLLDKFYLEGGRYIDTATNYPLNDNKDCFKSAERAILEWIEINQIKDLKIIYKVGSLSNSKVPENNISPNYLMNEIERLYNNFGKNLYTIMIHWDNRDDVYEIEQTLNYLSGLKKIDVGFSGIKHPEIYSHVMNKLEWEIPMTIELKHNFIQTSLSAYKPLFKWNPKLIAYGICAGGLKLSEDKYTEKSYVTLARSKNYHSEMLSKEIEKELSLIIKSNKKIGNLYNFAMLFAENTPELYGYIVAPTKIEQLNDIFLFRNTIRNNSFNSIFLNSH